MEASQKHSERMKARPTTLPSRRGLVPWNKGLTKVDYSKVAKSGLN